MYLENWHIYFLCNTGSKTVLQAFKFQKSQAKVLYRLYTFKALFTHRKSDVVFSTETISLGVFFEKNAWCLNRVTWLHVFFSC